ncbi:MAG: transglutaminase family protein [Lapillicoccus sp.]
MSTRLTVTHRTGYAYEKGALTSYNEARLTPPTTTDQAVMYSRVEISPKPWTFDYTDYWGTHVTAFEVHDRHTELVVTASSTVDIDRPLRAGAALTWAQLHAEARSAETCEYLELSPRVLPPADLADRLTAMSTAASTPAAYVEEVMRLIHDEVEYVTGSTDVAGHAADAWQKRAGVCQDMAHLALGALRAVGIPARYLSGYLLPDPDTPVGQTVTGESHAWVEWWDGLWLGFDPTNLLVPGDQHVEVAHGRDYVDVAPLSGVFTGGSTTGMFVEVDITRVR